MNGRLVKQIRKHTKRNFFQYLDEIKQWPFKNRWDLAWYILFGKPRKKK